MRNLDAPMNQRLESTPLHKGKRPYPADLKVLDPPKNPHMGTTLLYKRSNATHGPLEQWTMYKGTRDPR